MSGTSSADQVILQGEFAEGMIYQLFDLYTTFSLKDCLFCLGAGRTKTKQERKADSDSLQPYRKAELRNSLPSPSISRTYC